jgi:Peptidase C39 family
MGEVRNRFSIKNLKKATSATVLKNGRTKQSRSKYTAPFPSIWHNRNAEVTSTGEEAKGDPAAECLTLLLRYHGTAVDPSHIRHRFANANIGIAEILRCAKEFQFKARSISANWPQLAKMSFPLIAECNDYSSVIAT